MKKLGTKVKEMNEIYVRGRTYEVLPNGDHYTVVDEKGFAMINVATKEEAESAMINHINHCEALYRRNL